MKTNYHKTQCNTARINHDSHSPKDVLQYTTRKCKNTTQYNTAGINHDGRRPNSPQGCVTMPPGVPEPRQPLCVTNCTEKNKHVFLNLKILSLKIRMQAFQHSEHVTMYVFVMKTMREDKRRY